MNPSPATCLAALLASLGARSYYAASIEAESLIRLGKRASRIATQMCNGIERYDSKAGRVLASWTEDDENRAEKARAKIESEAAEILEPYRATDISASGDPRGFCLRWRFPNGTSNSFGGGTWGV